MFTPTHAPLAYGLRRLVGKNWSPAQRKWFIIAAMISDVPIDSCGIWDFVKYFSSHPQARNLRLIKPAVVNVVYHHINPYSVEMMRTHIGYDHGLWILDRILHAIPFWLTLLAIAYLVKRSPDPLMWLAICPIYCHIFPDWITHTFFGRSYLWPFMRHGLHGIISHENVVFTVIDALVSLVMVS